MTEPEFDQEIIDVLVEFSIDWGILYEYPKVQALVENILSARRYQQWVIDTDNGKRKAPPTIPLAPKSKT